jgi:Spy/CpxP family protein refolding chaperone
MLDGRRPAKMGPGINGGAAVKAITFIVAGVVLSGAVLAVALPQPPGPPGLPGFGFRAGGPPGDLAEVLRLSDTQKAAWKELLDEHRTQMDPLFEEGRKLHEEMRAALEEATPDPAKVGAAAIALQGHRKQVESEMKSFEEKQAALLDPDQRKQLETLRRERGFKRGPAAGPGGRRAPHGPPPFGAPAPFPGQ